LVLVEFREECGLGVDERLAGLVGNLFVGFQATVATDVLHGVAVFGEDAADEQAAMAVSGVFLAADQSDAKALHAGFEARDGGLEAGIVAEAAVEHSAFGVVIGGIGGTAAQLLAEEKIADVRLFKGALHQLPVKLRNVL
jgi:hypothetical protein